MARANHRKMASIEGQDAPDVEAFGDSNDARVSKVDVLIVVLVKNCSNPLYVAPNQRLQMPGCLHQLPHHRAHGCMTQVFVDEIGGFRQHDLRQDQPFAGTASHSSTRLMALFAGLISETRKLVSTIAVTIDTPSVGRIDAAP